MGWQPGCSIWGGVLLIFVTWVVVKVAKKDGNVKGPRSWPLIGAVPTHAANLHRFHDYITHYCRLYTTFRVAYPSFDYFYTSLPANVEHILKTNFHNYVKGSFVYDKQQEFLGNGIFSVDGSEWKQQRKTASYEFASRALKEFSEMAFREKAVALAKFVISEAQDRKYVDMQDLMLRLTFDSFLKLGFGLEMSTLQKNPPPEQLAFVHAFDESNAMVFLRYMDPLWRLKRWLRVGNEAKLVKSVATIDGIVFSYIEQRKREIQQEVKNNVKPDLLSRFLTLSESNPEEFSDRKIRDIILNFMIAGRDTTALTLSWLLYALDKNPSVQEKLMEELYQVEGLNNKVATNDGSFPSEEQIWRFANLLTYEKITGLQYLQACLQETLRLYPPVPNDLKVAVAPDTLPDGTKVKKGDCVNISPYAMGRMEWLWGEDAMEFQPERFIKDGICQLESPFKLTAFMAGPRLCLGKDFAFLQMKVTMAILLRFFKLEIVPGHDVRYRLMLTLHMTEDGLRMKVLPRSQKTT
eukprot:c22397_g1_i1 orf=197-1762(+)